jgi:hypothetical protein
MKLYPAHAMGIHAYCSDLIVDPEDDETVYFMSLAGYQAAVKGIVAPWADVRGIGVLDVDEHLSLLRELALEDGDQFPFLRI